MKVLSWNVQAFFDYHCYAGQYNDSYERVREVIRTSNADVCCFFEVKNDMFPATIRRSSGLAECSEVVRSIAAEFGYEYTHSYIDEGDSRHESLPNMVISRRYCTFRIFPNLTDSDGYQCYVVQAVFPQEKFTLYATHLDYSSAENRLRQVEQINEFVERESVHGHNCLVCGDFNALNRVDYSDAQWQLLSDLRQSRKWQVDDGSVMRSLLMTYEFVDALAVVPKVIAYANSGTEPMRVGRFAWGGVGIDAALRFRLPSATVWAGTRIDYFLLGKNFDLSRLLSYEAIDSDASDHVPIILEFTQNKTK